MTYRTLVEIMLERYGEAVTISGGQTTAIVQPLNHRSGLAKDLTGESGASLHYLYTGSADQVPQAGAVLKTARRDYTVLRADVYSVNGEEIYAWAVLNALAPEAATDVYLTAQGVKIARVQSYTAKAVQSSAAFTPWGESTPAAVAAGAVRYELSLVNLTPMGNTDLRTAADFSLVAESAGNRVVYTGCQWKSISDSGEVGTPVLRTAELTAAAREEGKEGDGNGE